MVTSSAQTLRNSPCAISCKALSFHIGVKTAWLGAVDGAQQGMSRLALRILLERTPCSKTMGSKALGTEPTRGPYGGHVNREAIHLNMHKHMHMVFN